MFERKHRREVEHYQIVALAMADALGESDGKLATLEAILAAQEDVIEKQLRYIKAKDCLIAAMADEIDMLRQELARASSGAGVVRQHPEPVTKDQR